MPTERISFGNQEAAGDAEIAGASPLAVNVVVDGKGAVRRRPGISAWSGFPATIPEASTITGITQFNGDVYYVNGYRNIHKVVVSTAIDTSLSANALSAALAGSGTPRFASTRFRLAIAGGDVPQKVDANATAAARLGGSPPKSTYMVMLNNRLISDDLTSSSTQGQFRMSGLGTTGEETWDALNYITADARPGAIVALKENTNELYVFCETVLQVFYPDPVTIYAPGRVRNLGCAASGAPIRIDEHFAWLDTRRRFLLSDARQDKDISGAMWAILDTLSPVSDCFGFRFDLDQFDCLVWSFPTDGRTFSYEMDGGWSQWQSWNSTTQAFGPLGITCHFFWESQNVHLVGLSTGQIAKFDTTANTDLGATIKAQVRTGFIDHGTTAYKSCQVLRLTLKRGQQSTAAQLLISWRDGLGNFCTPIPVNIGTTGDNVIVTELRSLGTYRKRQWQFEMTDAVGLVLASAEEVYDLAQDTEDM